jgi:uncharacterized membrane protein
MFFLVYFCLFNCDIIFKIINKLKVNNNIFKTTSQLKEHQKNTKKTFSIFHSLAILNLIFCIRVINAINQAFI